MTSSRCAARRSAGLSLVELLLATAITGLVAAAVAGMLFSVSYGTSSRKDMRSLVVKHKTVSARVGAAIRDSKMVLQSGTDYIVLWMGDTRDNDAPDKSEIQLIERDSVTKELRMYKAVWPDGWDEAQIEAADVSYDVSNNFKTIIDGYKGQSTFPLALWATNVTTWDIALNEVDPQAATLVSCRFTMETGDLTDTSILAAALRNTQQ